ncbi:uncharacterized protein LOC120338383 [Styela clava]
MYRFSFSIEHDSDFAKIHQCKATENRYDVYNGFAPYRMEWIECAVNIFPSVFSNATCLPNCQNPETEELLPATFQPHPVYSCQTFEVRRGGRIYKESVRLAHGCRCVSTAQPITLQQVRCQ